MAFPRFLLLLIALIPLTLFCADGGSKISLATSPSWVLPVDETNSPTGEDKSFGLEYLLVDRQVNVAEQSSFSHITYRVTSDSGLQRAAQITLDYDPDYESVDWHFLHLIRDGKILDRFNPESIKTIQQERDLDRHMYNGQLTALIMIDDVRVGDVIDYATTRHGINPIFKGMYLDSFYAGWIVPVRHQRIRVLYPAARTINFTIHEAGAFALKETVRANGASLERVWEGRNLKPLIMDEDQPAWFNPFPFIQATEYSDWSSVVNWALPLYTVNEPLTLEMRAKLDELLAHASTPEEKVIAVLDFVQRDVRYLGIEMGPRSHRPNPASEVFARRFGDCKDKARLFCTLLQAAGIEAYPALVHSTLKQEVRNWAASPYAFDHVIARVRVKGLTWWLDPTLSFQRGILRRRSALNYSPALVIAPDQFNLSQTQATSQIFTPTVFPKQQNTLLDLKKVSAIETPPPEPDDSELNYVIQRTQAAVDAEKSVGEPHLRLEEVFDLSAEDAPASLNVTSVYEGRMADSMRAYLANVNKEEFEKGLINYYAREYSEISLRSPPKWHDYEQENRIVVDEYYTIPEIWKHAQSDGTKEVTFIPIFLRDYTTKPQSPRRASPLRVSHPVNIDAVTIVKLHKPWPLQIPETWIINDAFSFHQSISAREKTVTISYQWRSKADHVSAERTAEYAAKLGEVRSKAGYYLSFNPSRDRQFAHYLPNWTLIGYTAAILVLSAAGIRWLWKKRPTQKSADEPPLLIMKNEPIEGWLILVAIGCCLRPLVFIGQFSMHYLRYFDRRIWINLAQANAETANSMLLPLLTVEFIAHLFFIVFSIVVAIFFFKRKYLFPRLAISLLVLTVAFSAVDLIVGQQIPSVQAAQIGTEVAGLVMLMIISSAWILYFKFSRQVKKTFIR